MLEDALVYLTGHVHRELYITMHTHPLKLRLSFLYVWLFFFLTKDSYFDMWTGTARN